MHLAALPGGGAYENLFLFIPLFNQWIQFGADYDQRDNKSRGPA